VAGRHAYYGGNTFTNVRWYACIFANTGPLANKDTAAPTLTNVSVNGVPYVPGMTVRSPRHRRLYADRHRWAVSARFGLVGLSRWQ
jgi:hypothetical protein